MDRADFKNENYMLLRLAVDHLKLIPGEFGVLIPNGLSYLQYGMQYAYKTVFPLYSHS